MAEQGRNYEEFFGSERRRLEGRLKEIDRNLDELRSERAAVQADLERLEKAMRLFEVSPTTISSAPRMTIKQGVLKVLKGLPHGLTAMGILERLKTELDMDYERTSLSPQLSRLKADGKIELAGGVWSLKQ